MSKVATKGGDTRFGRHCRILRIARGMTQLALARKTGIHRVQIAKIEAGKHAPTFDHACEIADALGVGLDHFRRPIRSSLV